MIGRRVGGVLGQGRPSGSTAPGRWGPVPDERAAPRAAKISARC